MKEEHESRLQREIGSLGLSALTLNAQIGAGIFVLPAVAAANTGEFSPWMFPICGVLILTIVLSFARAAGFFRRTGGPIVYATEAFGPFVGFQTGWLLFLSRGAAVAANSALLVTYAAWFWPALQTGPPSVLSVALVVIGLTILNIVGVRRSVHVLMVLTVLKLAPLGLVVLLGLGRGDLRFSTAAGIPDFETLGGTILILLYAFIGFESAVIPAGESRHPRRDIPRAMIGTVIATTLIYTVVQLACLSVKPDLGSSETPVADVAAILMGIAGAGVVTLGAIFSIAGNLSQSLLAAPRMTYALARDGSLPSWLARIHPRFRTPSNSIIFFGVLSLALALSGTFVWLAVMSTLARLLCYSVCIAALPRLGKMRDNGFRLPGRMLVPVVALVVCFWMFTQASLGAWVTTLSFCAIGSLFFRDSRRRSRVP